MKQIEQYAICLDENYDDGIKQLASLVADKKVVGVGESTHGTHEFFQLKADLACELIMNHGFRTFALEDEGYKSRAINDFIQTGKGTVDEVIAPLYSVWRTEEIKDLILRLTDLADSYEINFICIDIDQSKIKGKSGKDFFEQRDKMMADNIMESVDEGKVFVWAHNAHISRLHLDLRNIGKNLSEDIGENYAAIGQFFGQGTFSARIVPSDDEELKNDYSKIPLSPIQASMPKKGYLEEALSKSKCGSYFIDLTDNKLEELDREYECRSIGWGAMIENVDRWPMKVSPNSYYDVLVYFKEARHSNAINRKA